MEKSGVTSAGRLVEKLVETLAGLWYLEERRSGQCFVIGGEEIELEKEEGDAGDVEGVIEVRDEDEEGGSEDEEDEEDEMGGSVDEEDESPDEEEEEAGGCVDAEVGVEEGGLEDDGVEDDGVEVEGG